jgi:ABC-type spermidine/putrescine transport system permease subunit I
MSSRRYLLALGLPGLIWVALFVSVALYALVAIAVGSLDPLVLTPVPAWNPLHWSSQWLTQIGTDLKPFSGEDWVVFQRTAIYIAIALFGCIVVGYPVAYYTAICAKRSRGLILALLVAPLLVSYMLRMLAWVGLLAPTGWVNAVLVPLGIVPSQFDWLSGRSVTVVFGLMYGWIPYFIIPLYAALARFDTRYLEASRDLGAGGLQTFLHVTLPISKQGILAGTVIVALPMFGDFFTNGLLSGVSSTAMVGTLINTYAQSQTEQALAAAAAVWLTVFLAILLIPYLRSSARATREVTG